MLDSVIFVAFVVGIVSAVSLPMGAITAFFWRPSDRVIAILMAFGGGALLAALTIDLVASTVEKGHFNALALGAIIGGLLFVFLNHIVNDLGGFLRKVSTTVYHLRRKQYEHLQRISNHLERVDLFEVLEENDFKMLADAVSTAIFQKGDWIYQQGDPSEFLYIIVDGGVELIDPLASDGQAEQLKRYDVFGWRALITHSPVYYSARALSKTTLWLLPISALEKLNKNSQAARNKVLSMLDSENILCYLQQQQNQNASQSEQWLNEARTLLKQGEKIPPAIPLKRQRTNFQSKIDFLQNIPLTRGLSESAMHMISECLIYKKHKHGSSFYHQNDQAERMYIIETGEVTLLDATKGRHESIALKENEAFGDISMITGAKHSVTAVAAVDTSVWELRKKDFDLLLTQIPELLDRVRSYIKKAGMEGYLKERHQIDDADSARWLRKALHNVDQGKAVPAVANLNKAFSSNHGAPLAIWLGITLDGIPESLVIGASMIDGFIEFSLITGLFLSNYPEALSSSIGMAKQRLSKSRILLMWSSLMLFTGIGAALGSIFFIGASPASFALVQGIAAGAMLTMIAETMLPEAYFKGGSVVGLSTLMGFLIAIFTKSLERSF